jgi:hypothetical protein
LALSNRSCSPDRQFMPNILRVINLRRSWCSAPGLLDCPLPSGSKMANKNIRLCRLSYLIYHQQVQWGGTYAIVELRDSGWVKLFLLDSDPIFKDLFPSFLEQPRTISTTPPLMRDFLHVPIFIVSPHYSPKFSQLLDNILFVSHAREGLHTATTSTGSFLNDLGQARSGLFSLSPGLRRILSFFFASVIFSLPALLSSSKSRR